jgi:ribosomal protein S18 acetylase RimI-like enzyme
MSLPDGYRLRKGSGADRTLLLEFMCRTYQEFFPEQQKFSHLADTVAQYFSPATPVWWIEFQRETVGCLWMGSGVDQVTGNKYGHIFLVYVSPAHRRRGLATTLMRQAESWTKSQGHFQLGLQVFLDNKAALHLYQRCGFQPQSFLMVKPFYP